MASYFEKACHGRLHSALRSAVDRVKYYQLKYGYYFMATQLTSKGQVTIPKTVREYLGLKPGTAVTFERLASGEVVLRPARGRVRRRTSRYMKLRGRATVRMKTEEILALTRG